MNSRAPEIVSASPPHSEHPEIQEQSLLRLGGRSVAWPWRGELALFAAAAVGYGAICIAAGWAMVTPRRTDEADRNLLPLSEPTEIGGEGSDPRGIRTLVHGLKGRCPGPG